METNLLTLLKVVFTQSKVKINGLLCDPFILCENFASGVHPQCCYTLLHLKYLPISVIKIKGIQTGDHEIKIVNFVDNTTMFLRDIICLNRIQLILKELRNYNCKLILCPSQK